jgi:hypothetical protein
MGSFSLVHLIIFGVILLLPIGALVVAVILLATRKR